MMNSVLQMMNSVFKMMNYVFKMMDFGRDGVLRDQAGHRDSVLAVRPEQEGRAVRPRAAGGDAQPVL